jgi:hypothetical protein
MPAFPATPALRLVRGPAAATPLSALNFRAGQVRLENAAAAGIQPTDARWVLAVRTATLLEGGRAAILSPERRRRILAVAHRMGLRPFDASMVIAVVQDAARTGEAPLGRATQERLTLVRPPAATDVTPGALFAISLGLAALIFAAVARWMGGF